MSKKAKVRFVRRVIPFTEKQNYNLVAISKAEGKAVTQFVRDAVNDKLRRIPRK